MRVSQSEEKELKWIMTISAKHDCSYYRLCKGAFAISYRTCKMELCTEYLLFSLRLKKWSRRCQDFAQGYTANKVQSWDKHLSDSKLHVFPHVFHCQWLCAKSWSMYLLTCSLYNHQEKVHSLHLTDEKINTKTTILTFQITDQGVAGPLLELRIVNI